MSFEPASKPARSATTRSERGDDCRNAHAQIDRFFTWAGYGNPWKILEWHTWATFRIRAGDTLDAVVKRMKEAWYAHCRATGRPTKAERMDADLFGALLGVQQEIEAHALCPAQVAVVWRSLSAQFSLPWLGEWAEHFVAMGQRWAEVLWDRTLTQEEVWA